jgi:hypothetical protein
MGAVLRRACQSLDPGAGQDGRGKRSRHDLDGQHDVAASPGGESLMARVLYLIIDPDLRTPPLRAHETAFIRIKRPRRRRFSA